MQDTNIRRSEQFHKEAVYSEIERMSRSLYSWIKRFAYAKGEFNRGFKKSLETLIAARQD